jgi:hypothetical protein
VTGNSAIELTCAGCGERFLLPEAERSLREERGLADPTECPACRARTRATRNADLVALYDRADVLAFAEPTVSRRAAPPTRERNGNRARPTPNIIPQDLLARASSAAASAPAAPAERGLLDDFQLILENTTSATHYRNDPLPETPKNREQESRGTSNWDNLLRATVRGATELPGDVRLTLDTAFRWRRDDDTSIDAEDDLRLDLRQLYLSAGTAQSFVDAGRINIRTGVASGFNPTDFFRANTVTDRLTEDVSELRLTRLGALAVRGLHLWDNGGMALAFVPGIASASDEPWTHEDIIGLRLDQSNPRTRLQLSVSQRLAPGFQPELVAFLDGKDPFIGANASYGIGERWLAYGEWAIGYRRTLIDEAVRAQRDEGRLSGRIAEAFKDEGKEWLNQAAVGVSYTSTANVTTQVEVHYNEAGLDGGDWNDYFDLAKEADADPNARSAAGTAGNLLGIRNAARNRVEPLSRWTLFLRSAVADFPIDDASLVGLANVNPYDGSVLTQVEGRYNFTKSLVGAVQLGANLGPDRKSEYGSTSRDLTARLQLQWFF